MARDEAGGTVSETLIAPRSPRDELKAAALERAKARLSKVEERELEEKKVKQERLSRRSERDQLTVSPPKERLRESARKLEDSLEAEKEERRRKREERRRQMEEEEKQLELEVEARRKKREAVREQERLLREAEEETRRQLEADRRKKKEAEEEAALVEEEKRLLEQAEKAEQEARERRAVLELEERQRKERLEQEEAAKQKEEPALAVSSGLGSPRVVATMEEAQTSPRPNSPRKLDKSRFDFFNDDTPASAPSAIPSTTSPRRVVEKSPRLTEEERAAKLRQEEEEREKRIASLKKLRQQSQESSPPPEKLSIKERIAKQEVVSGNKDPSPPVSPRRVKTSGSVFDRLASKEQEVKEEKALEEKAASLMERVVPKKEEQLLSSLPSSSEIECPDCKTANKPGYKFCDHCGRKNPLPSSTSLSSASAVVSSLETQVFKVPEQKTAPEVTPLRLSQSGSIKPSDFRKHSLPGLKMVALQSSMGEEGFCMTCQKPLVDAESIFCEACAEQKAESSGFKSARGVSGSPFLQQREVSRSTSSVQVSPRKLGSSINLGRSMSKLSGTSALLLWVQKRVTHVEAPSGWKTGWQDGLVLCSLVSHFYPDAIDFEALPKDGELESRVKNVTLAMEILEKNGVPSLLDPQDMADVQFTEPRSLQTYISEIRKRLDPNPEGNSLSSADSTPGATPLSSRKNNS